MLSYCLRCREKTVRKNPKPVKTKKRKIMVISNCAVFSSKKSKFIKEEEARGLLSTLEIKIPLVVPFLF